MNKLKVCIVQSDVVWENPEKNRLHFKELIKNSKDKKDLIILPEMFTTGFSMEPVRTAELFHQEMDTLVWMREIAKENNSFILASIPVEEEDDYFNRILVVGPQGEYYSYDKKYLFSLSGENKSFKSGDSRLIFEIGDWKICPLICYDLRFPEWARNKIVSDIPEYDVLIYTANWPSKRNDHWTSLIRSRAVENQCYCIGVNRLGEDGNGYLYNGASCAYDYNASVLLNPVLDDEVVITLELSKKNLNEFRSNLPFLWDQ